MKLNDILNLWEIDAVIDRSALDVESGKIPQVHSKYYNILVSERLALRRLEADYKKLKLDKWEFYTQGSFKGDERGWKLPPSGNILKQDIPMYLDADDDIQKNKLQIDYQTEKVEALISIMKQISEKQWHIKNMISWKVFMAGNG